MISQDDIMREEISWLNEDVMFYTKNIKLLEAKRTLETLDYRLEFLDAMLESDRRLLTEKQDRRQGLLG